MIERTDYVEPPRYFINPGILAYIANAGRTPSVWQIA